LVNEINLDPQTKVKVKNIDVELIEGDLTQKPWLIHTDKHNYVLLEEEQYDKFIKLLRDVLEQNLELKLEQRIMSELPIDVEDVKAVVKQEIKDNNISIEEALKKVKNNYPNLFHKVDLETIFQELL
jgi:hypothetical protein